MAVNRHPCLNGNKRTALISMLVHLDRNEFSIPGVSQAELYSTMVAIADHKLASRGKAQKRSADEEVRAISGWLHEKTQKERVCRDYVRAIWDSMPVRLQLEGSAKTSAGIYKINQGYLEAIALPLPTIADQELLAAEIDRRTSLAASSEAQVELADARAAYLRQSILARAFSGQLVPQDPNDESASALLERIRAERAKTPARGGKRRSPSRVAAGKARGRE